MGFFFLFFTICNFTTNIQEYCLNKKIEGLMGIDPSSKQLSKKRKVLAVEIPYAIKFHSCYNTVPCEHVNRMKAFLLYLVLHESLDIYIKLQCTQNNVDLFFCIKLEREKEIHKEIIIDFNLILKNLRNCLHVGELILKNIDKLVEIINEFIVQINDFDINETNTELEQKLNYSMSLLEKINYRINELLKTPHLSIVQICPEMEYLLYKLQLHAVFLVIINKFHFDVDFSLRSKESEIIVQQLNNYFETVPFIGTIPNTFLNKYLEYRSSFCIEISHCTFKEFTEAKSKLWHAAAQKFSELYSGESSVFNETLNKVTKMLASYIMNKTGHSLINSFDERSYQHKVINQINIVYNNINVCLNFLKDVFERLKKTNETTKQMIPESQVDIHNFFDAKYIELKSIVQQLYTLLCIFNIGLELILKYNVITIFGSRESLSQTALILPLKEIHLFQSKNEFEEVEKIVAKIDNGNMTLYSQIQSLFDLLQVQFNKYNVPTLNALINQYILTYQELFFTVNKINEKKIPDCNLTSKSGLEHVEYFKQDLQTILDNISAIVATNSNESSELKRSFFDNMIFDMRPITKNRITNITYDLISYTETDRRFRHTKQYLINKAICLLLQGIRRVSN